MSPHVDKSERVLAYLLEQPAHRWIGLDVIQRGTRVREAQVCLLQLIAAGLAGRAGLSQDPRYQASARARQQAAQAAQITNTGAGEGRRGPATRAGDGPVGRRVAGAVVPSAGVHGAARAAVKAPERNDVSEAPRLGVGPILSGRADPRSEPMPARGLTRFYKARAAEIRIGHQRLDLFRVDGITCATVSNLLDFGPRHVALAGGGR